MLVSCWGGKLLYIIRQGGLVVEEDIQLEEDCDTLVECCGLFGLLYILQKYADHLVI